MEAVASTSTDDRAISTDQSSLPISEEKKNVGGTFECSYCPLIERFDYKGAKPPFAKQIVYLEECYVMKDPFSLPNRGEVLVLGADCANCKKSVCLGCSIFYTKRFCQKCAMENIHHLPAQIHPKIKNLTKETDAQT